MHSEAAPRVFHTLKARTILRIVIASYFLAVALGAIPGTDFNTLIEQIAPPRAAPILSAALVFGLAYMVMIGVWTRGAALVLGLMVLFSAYLEVIVPAPGHGVETLGGFWRDLALIAALLLSYAEPQLPAEARAAAGRIAGKAKVTPRRVIQPTRLVKPAPQPAEIAVLAEARVAASRRKARISPRPVDLRAPLAADEIEEVFHSDRSIAQVT